MRPFRGAFCSRRPEHIEGRISGYFPCARNEQLRFKGLKFIETAHRDVLRTFTSEVPKASGGHERPKLFSRGKFLAASWPIDLVCPRIWFTPKSPK